MATPNQSPIKVSPEAKAKIRMVAALRNCAQSHLVETAIDEFVARHADELSLGLKHAREALLAGKAESLAYLLGEDGDAVRRVSGGPQRGRRPSRATS